MSLKGLRFTLEVDGQEPDTFAVVSFRLIQRQSTPFVLSVNVASDSFMQTAEMLLEKKAVLTSGRGYCAALRDRRGGGIRDAGEQRVADGLPDAYPAAAVAVRPATEFPHFPAAGHSDDIGDVTERERGGRRCFMKTTRRVSSACSTGRVTWAS